MIDLESIRSHLFDREYMSGVERDTARIKSTGEVFTSDPAVQKMLDLLPPDFFKDPTKTAIDPACGDGQWLAEILWRKLQADHDFETALGTIYGIDIMADNVHECRRRLLCGREDLRPIVEQNIVCADGLRYHYRFDGSPPYDEATEILRSQAPKKSSKKGSYELRPGLFETSG